MRERVNTTLCAKNNSDSDGIAGDGGGGSVKILCKNTNQQSKYVEMNVYANDYHTLHVYWVTRIFDAVHDHWHSSLTFSIFDVKSFSEYKIFYLLTVYRWLTATVVHFHYYYYYFVHSLLSIYIRLVPSTSSTSSSLILFSV